MVRQIANGLRRLLLDGELKAGDALPSSRALGRDLGVHFNTVAQAYRVLEAEGWLELKRRAGTLVRDRVEPELNRARADELAGRFADELSDLRARYRSEGLDEETLDGVVRDLIDERRSSR